MGDFYYEVSLAEAGHDSFTIMSCLLITKRHDRILILLTEIKKRIDFMFFTQFQFHDSFFCLLSFIKKCYNLAKSNPQT